MKKMTQKEIVRTGFKKHNLGPIGDITFNPCFYCADGKYKFSGGIHFKLGYTYDLGELPNAKSILIKRVRGMLLDALKDLESFDNS